LCYYSRYELQGVASSDFLINIYSTCYWNSGQQRSTAQSIESQSWTLKPIFIPHFLRDEVALVLYRFLEKTTPCEKNSASSAFPNCGHHSSLMVTSVLCAATIGKWVELHYRDDHYPRCRISRLKSP